MEKITCFRTYDGQLFEDENSACKHEKKLDFGIWYEENKLYGRYEGSCIELEEIQNWLTENAEEIRAFLEEFSSDRQS